MSVIVYIFLIVNKFHEKIQSQQCVSPTQLSCGSQLFLSYKTGLKYALYRRIHN